MVTPVSRAHPTAVGWAWASLCYHCRRACSNALTFGATGDLDCAGFPAVGFTGRPGSILIPGLVSGLIPGAGRRSARIRPGNGFNLYLAALRTVELAQPPLVAVGVEYSLPAKVCSPVLGRVRTSFSPHFRQVLHSWPSLPQAAFCSVVVFHTRHASLCKEIPSAASGFILRVIFRVLGKRQNAKNMVDFSNCF